MESTECLKPPEEDLDCQLQLVLVNFNMYMYEQTLGVGEGQEGLACCSPSDCKEVDMTSLLNNNSNV